MPTHRKCISGLPGGPRVFARFKVGLQRIAPNISIDWEIPFSPPKMIIRFAPLFGLRFKKINLSGDFGILMEKIRSGDFSIFDY